MGTGDGDGYRALMLDRTKVEKKREFPVMSKKDEEDEAESEEGVIPSQLDELVAKLSSIDE